MADTIKWIDADSGETDLTDAVHYAVLWGMRGDYAPNYLLTEQVIPQQAGALLSAVRMDARGLEVPIVLTDSTEALYLARARDLIGKLDPTRGDGRIRITRGDGTARELTCRCASGLNSSSLDQEPSLGWVRSVLSFRAHDPFWYALTQAVIDYTMGTPPNFFPFFPLVVSAGGIFGDSTLTNPGDTDAWPVLTVTGPTTYIAWSNLTTGKVLEMTYALNAGETIIIDTRPQAKTVLTGAGVNAFSALTAASAMWSLRRGANHIQVVLTGATVASAARLAYYPRYLSA